MSSFFSLLLPLFFFLLLWFFSSFFLTLHYISAKVAINLKFTHLIILSLLSPSSSSLSLSLSTLIFSLSLFLLMITHSWKSYENWKYNFNILIPMKYSSRKIFTRKVSSEISLFLFSFFSWIEKYCQRKREREGKKKQRKRRM